MELQQGKTAARARAAIISVSQLSPDAATCQRGISAHRADKSAVAAACGLPSSDECRPDASCRAPRGGPAFAVFAFGNADMILRTARAIGGLRQLISTPSAPSALDEAHGLETS